MVRGPRAEIGNDKTLVESPWQPFHLGHDPAGSLPRVGLITEGGKRALLAACALEGPLSLGGQFLDLLPESVIGNHADHIRDTMLFQEAVDRRDGEAGVRAEQNAASRIGFLQLLDQPLQDRNGRFRGVRVAGAKHRRQEGIRRGRRRSTEDDTCTGHSSRGRSSTADPHEWDRQWCPYPERSRPGSRDGSGGTDRPAGRPGEKDRARLPGSRTGRWAGLTGEIGRTLRQPSRAGS